MSKTIRRKNAKYEYRRILWNEYDSFYEISKPAHEQIRFRDLDFKTGAVRKKLAIYHSDSGSTYWMPSSGYRKVRRQKTKEYIRHAFQRWLAHQAEETPMLSVKGEQRMDSWL